MKKVSADKKMIKAQGPIWHQKQKQQGSIPKGLRGLDREATWGTSRADGWIYGHGSFNQIRIDDPRTYHVCIRNVGKPLKPCKAWSKRASVWSAGGCVIIRTIVGSLPPWESLCGSIKGEPFKKSARHGRSNKRSWDYKNSATPQLYCL
jgi:hypothetical protein